MNDIWWMASPKGGSGTSTIAAVAAITLAQRDGPPVVLVDRCGDQRALLGLMAPSLDMDVDLRMESVAPDLDLMISNPATAQPDDLHRLSARSVVVVDAGRDQAACEGAHRIMVIRACYLALIRAQQWTGYQPDGVIVVEEPGRALRLRDVGAALNQPEDTMFRTAWDQRVARSIDAGTIVSMVPPPLRRSGVPDMLERLTGAGRV